MHTAAIIIVCFGAVFTAGFLLAGFAALLTPDDDELKRFKQELAAAKQKGIWEEYLAMRRGALPFSHLPPHWRSRPDARRSIWIGFVSAVITLIAAQFI
jgi:hypothetical protein